MTKTSEQRSNNYLKQLKGSFIFKLLAILISFVLIPIMIKYLGNEQYGIWSTLLSIVSWIALFDIGIGNGLRNKISESLAKDNTQDAQNYISTAYMAIGLISVVLLSTFLLASNYVSWQSVFNTKVLSNDDLKAVVNISAGFLFINFWLSLINQVFNGLQKSSLVVFSQFLSNFLSLGFVYILYIYSERSLIKLAFFYGLSVVVVNLMISMWFFKRNINLLPKLQLYSTRYVKSITSLGFKFFIIQIAVVVIFTTDKILITQLFGPEYVTNYDVVFKLFSIITIVHSLLMAPLWSAYSDAYHRKDIDWIKKTIKNQLKIYTLFIFSTIILIFSAKPIISLWIGGSVSIEIVLIFSVGLFVLVSTWNNIFAFVINGTNKLFIATTINIFLAFINIPLSIIMVKIFNFGTEGIVLGTVLSLLIGSVLAPLQVYYIIHKKGSLIWHR